MKQKRSEFFLLSSRVINSKSVEYLAKFDLYLTFQTSLFILILKDATSESPVIFLLMFRNLSIF